MSGTLCWRHFEPVLKDGGPEPEVLTIWPLTPCAICGEWPGAYDPIKKFYAVRDNTVARARLLFPAIDRKA